MMTVKTRLRLSTAILLAAFALTLYVGAQESFGQYPTLPQYPNTGARYVFRPPAGWHRVQTTAIGLGVWVYPGASGFGQSISVRAENFTGTLADYAALVVSRIRRDHPDAKTSRLERTTVCAGHLAIYFSWEANASGQTLVYEDMVTIYGGTAYHASYTRALGQPSIPAARTSLTTLCGGNPPGAQTSTGSPTPGAYTSAPSPVSPYSTPLPQASYGTVVPTVTPRISP
jgi:hypothetical protein